ncbi:MAG: type II toxin-antitoxin system PemK/MazF family toxin [Candidatus Ranarchaeia archaeon]
MKGSIILVPFPFTDLTSAKLRPALVLYEGNRDAVVAFISSKVPASQPATGVVIDQHQPQFKSTGLKTSSVIRLDKVATLLKSLIIGELGHLSQELKINVTKKINKIYSLL